MMSRFIFSPHITSHHLTSHVISFHLSHHVMSPHITSSLPTSYHFTSPLTSHHLTSHITSFSSLSNNKTLGSSLGIDRLKKACSALSAQSKPVIMAQIDKIPPPLPPQKSVSGPSQVRSSLLFFFVCGLFERLQQHF